MLSGSRRLSLALLAVPLLSLVVLSAMRTSMEREPPSLRDVYRLGRVGDPRADELFASPLIEMATFADRDVANAALLGEHIDGYLWTEDTDVHAQFGRSRRSRALRRLMTDVLEVTNRRLFEQEAVRRPLPDVLLAPLLIDADALDRGTGFRPVPREETPSDNVRPGPGGVPAPPSIDPSLLVARPPGEAYAADALGERLARPDTIEEGEELAVPQPGGTNPIAGLMAPLGMLIPILFFASSFGVSLTGSRLGGGYEVLSAYVPQHAIMSGKAAPHALLAVAVPVTLSMVLAPPARASLPLLVLATTAVVATFFALTAAVCVTTSSYASMSASLSVAYFLGTVGLLLPTLLSGVHDVAFYSPLTTVLHVLRGEPPGPEQVGLSLFFPGAFSLAMLLGVLGAARGTVTGGHTLWEALVLATRESLPTGRPSLLLGMLTGAGTVFLGLAGEVAVVALATLVRVPFVLLITVLMGVEEAVKGAAFLLLHRAGRLRSDAGDVVPLALAVGVGFLVFEKLYNVAFITPFVGVEGVAQTLETLLLLPILPVSLVVHGVCTTVFALVYLRSGRAPLALGVATLLHGAYNLAVVMMWM
ncbi:MAG: hypothetical protein QGG50_00135 [Methanopyri archaeon]|nr:hypothetical protein [Methanopyri archaeon]